MKNFKFGFTLAEVLITLAIIGVVAALTLPTLLANYQKQYTSTKLKKTYAELVQAIKLSEAENGPIKTWAKEPYTIEGTTNFVNKYIVPYYNSLTLCTVGNDGTCGAAVSSTGANYVTLNGTLLAFVYDSNVIPLIIDINGRENSSIDRGNFASKMGHDIFYFYIDLKDGSVKPYGWYEGITREDILNNTANVKCKKVRGEDEDELYRYGCTALLYLDGFEFKRDYPW